MGMHSGTQHGQYNLKADANCYDLLGSQIKRSALIYTAYYRLVLHGCTCVALVALFASSARDLPGI